MLATPWLKRIDLLTGELTPLALAPSGRLETHVVDGASAFIEYDGSGCWYHHARGAKQWLLHGTAITTESAVFVFMEHPEARHPELEAALVASPGDRGAVAVYADWLEERGDPFAGVLNPTLLAARGPAGLWFLEGLERHQAVTATLRDGLVREVEVGVPADQLRSTLHRLCHLRACLALERLSVAWRSLSAEVFTRGRRGARARRQARGDGAVTPWATLADPLWRECRWPASLQELRFTNAPGQPGAEDLAAFTATLRRRAPRVRVVVEASR